MRNRKRASAWARIFERQFVAMTRMATAAGKRALANAPQPAATRRTRPSEAGAWIPGGAIGATGARRFRLYRPPGVKPGERLPLMVMLHGCGQSADSFAASTRMNRVALRERAGLSAGASIAALLVTRHPDRFKGLDMHSGVPPGTAHSTLSAMGAMKGRRPTQPPAEGSAAMAVDWPLLLVIHGAADAVVSPRNGQAAAELWAHQAGARPDAARQLRRGQRYPMSVMDFKRTGRTVATLVVVEGLTHAWSGGTASQPFSDARGPDASRMAWAFAARQFRYGAR